MFKQQGHVQNVQVPFSDGTKTMTIVTDLKKLMIPIESMINDFEKTFVQGIIDETEHHLKKWTI